MQGIVSTLHQVMRCQSPDGKYTINIKGDQSQARKCHIVLRTDEASISGTKDEELSTLLQSKEYLPAYLKKFEEEIDEPIATIEKLVEVVLEEAKPKKIVLVKVELKEA